jgi:hypothetical protein
MTTGRGALIPALTLARKLLHSKQLTQLTYDAAKFLFLDLRGRISHGASGVRSKMGRVNPRPRR